MLADVAERIQEEDQYDARICLDVPESAALQSKDGDVFNLEASLECLGTADAAVFVFISPEKYRFREFGPTPNEEDADYYDSVEIPREIHSSAVIELYHWCQVSAGLHPTLVIYENGMEEHLGSLVRGVVKSGDITVREIETSSRGDAVDSIKTAVAAQSQIWATELEDLLCERIGVFDEIN